MCVAVTRINCVHGVPAFRCSISLSDNCDLYSSVQFAPKLFDKQVGPEVKLIVMAVIASTETLSCVRRCFC